MEGSETDMFPAYGTDISAPSSAASGGFIALEEDTTSALLQWHTPYGVHAVCFVYMTGYSI